MRTLIFGLFFLSLLFGCKDSKEVKQTEEKIVYDMYQPSEMANLMNEMYAHNLEIKKAILEGGIPTQFPMDFLKIHTAELSAFKSRNETFESFSKLFIETEKEIFNEASTIPLEDRYNNAINLCISCHQTECTGPIPRIKKLLIK